MSILRSGSVERGERWLAALLLWLGLCHLLGSLLGLPFSIARPRGLEWGCVGAASVVAAVGLAVGGRRVLQLSAALLLAGLLARIGSLFLVPHWATGMFQRIGPFASIGWCLRDVAPVCYVVGVVIVAFRRVYAPRGAILRAGRTLLLASAVSLLCQSGWFLYDFSLVLGGPKTILQLGSPWTRLLGFGGTGVLLVCLLLAARSCRPGARHFRLWVTTACAVCAAVMVMRLGFTWSFLCGPQGGHPPWVAIGYFAQGVGCSMVATACLALVLLRVGNAYESSAGLPVCLACGYCLIGCVSPYCPECGRPVPIFAEVSGGGADGEASPVEHRRPS
jgi:hypothetical protein